MKNSILIIALLGIFFINSASNAQETLKIGHVNIAIV